MVDLVLKLSLQVMEIKIANFINLNFEKIIIQIYKILCSHTVTPPHTCVVHIYSCKYL